MRETRRRDSFIHPVKANVCKFKSSIQLALVDAQTIRGTPEFKGRNP